MAPMISLLALLLLPQTGPEPQWQALFPDGELGEWRVVGGDGEYSFEEEGGWPVLYGRGATGRNTFLVSPREYSDFELEIDVKIEAGGNSGIQFRSHVREDGRLYGYQAEIDPSERAWSAGIYDEGRRGWLDDLSDNDAARAAFRVGEWNTYRIVARGPLLRTWVNGVPAADLFDEADASGFLALQVHNGGKTHVRWHNARLREFPPAWQGAPAMATAFFEGIDMVPQRGTPGLLAVFDRNAMPLLLSGKRPLPVAAYAHYGEGRVLAIAHNSYAGEGTEFRARALRWLGAQAAGPEVRVLTWRGDGPTAEQLAQTDVLLMTGTGPLAPERAAELREWVARGGSLFAALCPWGWQQVSARRGWTLPQDLGENQLLAPAGLAFTDGYADASADGGFAVTPARLHEGHALLALASLPLASGPDAIDVAPVEHALRNAPEQATRFRELFQTVIGPVLASAAPRPGKPVKANDAYGRLAVVAVSGRWRELPPEEVQAAPGVEHFPGAVDEDALPVAHAARYEAAPGTGWQSTGLYLAPGAVLSVQLTDGSVDGWRLRVGCHKDQLWQKDQWSRWPEITGEWPLSEGLRVATPWGGPVYLIPGDGAAPLGVEISGAVVAPHWQPGMSAAAWRKRLAASEAPWTELEGEHIVLSVPTEAAALLDDPEPLMGFWDSVMEAHCKLGAEPLPRRKERLVADAQISAGYMHAGYPIMTWLDVVELPKNGGLPVVLDLETLRSKGNWGYFHELGHNRQQPEWTFGGTGEVTCNWFSLHAGELLCGIEPWQNPWLKNQKKKGAEYLAAGADYAQWRSNPGLALLCYAQLQHEFGWQPFYEVVAAYRTLPEGERPRDDAQKRDQWVRRMSLATGRDLRPFHAAWGWPLGEALLADPQLDALKPWGADPGGLLD